MTKSKLPPKKTVKKDLGDPKQTKPYTSTASSIVDDLIDNSVDGNIEIESSIKSGGVPQDLDVKVVAAITIAYKPTIVICKVPEALKAGLYYIQNINDVMIVQQVWVSSGFVEYDGNGRIELVVMNLVDDWFHLETNFAIAKLLSAKVIG